METNPNILTLAAMALLRRPAVEQLTGKSRSTLYRDIEKGLFVKPVPIGGGRVGWPLSEINAQNAARIAGKSEEEIKLLVVELEAARKGGVTMEGQHTTDAARSGIDNALDAKKPD